MSDPTSALQDLLNQIEQQIAALEKQGPQDDPGQRAALETLKTHHQTLQARLTGGGAIAQSGSTAVGAGSIHVGGNVEKSSIIQGDNNQVHTTHNSGTFHGPVRTGGTDEVHVSGGFYQPGMTVHGDAYQAMGDMTVAGRDVNQGGEALAKIFAEARARVQALPAEEQSDIEPIVVKIEEQAKAIQQGDESPETQSFLEKRMRALQAMSSDIGEVVITSLASPAAGVSLVLQKIAQKVLGESKGGQGGGAAGGQGAPQLPPG